MENSVISKLEPEAAEPRQIAGAGAAPANQPRRGRPVVFRDELLAVAALAGATTRRAQQDCLYRIRATRRIRQRMAVEPELAGYLGWLVDPTTGRCLKPS